MSEKLEWYLNDSFIPNASASPLIWKLKVGTWKLLVRDPMSGREGQCEFVVVH
jgi:membrane carboxypeptidase/penicillin-binding protein PbpC